jgi:hypothetical protein
VSGEAILFRQALDQPKIINGERENLVKALRWVMMKVGLRQQNWPTTEETAVLIQHLESNYGGHTVDEIKLAFDMAIAGKLDVEVNCYENFSCLYFSNIMAAYREWAKEEYKQIEAKQPIALPEIKEDMSAEAMTDWFNATAKKIKAGELKVDFVPLMLYEFMDHNGNITATKEEKYMYLQRAADYRQSQLQEEYEKNSTQATQWRLSNFISQKNRGYFEGEAADAVKSLAKKILLFEMIINS